MKAAARSRIEFTPLGDEPYKVVLHALTVKRLADSIPSEGVVASPGDMDTAAAAQPVQ